MLKETLSTQAFQLLKRICQDKTFKDFHLVGGTALALQLGHRKSKDLDFFTAVKFEASLFENLKNWGEHKIITATTNTAEIEINGIRLFFMFFGYPLNKEIHEEQNIRMADPIDIGLMKLMCLTSRQTKKDIIDLYFIDRDVIALENLLKIIDKHIPEESFNKYSAAKELLDPDKLQHQPMPLMLKNIQWEQAYNKVAKKIEEHLLNCAKD